MKNSTSSDLQELTVEEMKNTNGGGPILAFIGLAACSLLIGAAVGYGLYRLVKWAVY